MTTERKIKLAFVLGSVALTVGIHYGWILEPLFGESHWIHAIHGRFCYIPIVIAASWFGLRGGLLTAAAISILVLPYVFRTATASPHNLAGEVVEIVFYFAIATLSGWLVDREWSIRRRQEETQLQLERSQKLSLVGQMAATVAHEVKNPLASIKGAVEILSDDSTRPSDREEFRGIISREIKRIDATAREFLDFARPRETRLERLNLSDTLRDTLKQMEAQASRSGIAIESHIENDLVVHADDEKIRQVVLNLLLNALDASPAQSAIKVKLSRRGTNHLTLEVTDHGPGISRDDLDKVFEPFFTTKSSGSGLGLAVVKSIVESHHGDITIRSTPGTGTTVTVTLPALKEAS